MTALWQVSRYGRDGVELLIAALHDRALVVQKTASPSAAIASRSGGSSSVAVLRSLSIV
ncbi:MAG: hypothetical protein HC881_09745 [Leptolyngbyaceae cyanobacterium SL_7_1]|nr:hypothetical protein [Leptolyngbyaceae cyanobacterium SL_7_1]